MTRIEVLDHGYLSLVETWGSDERIVEAARMSTGKGFLGWGPACEKCGEGRPPCNVAAHGTVGCPVHGEVPGVPGDEKLLRFLWEHRHATPFEMAGLVVEVKAPIFVFREWHRHRTQCLGPDTLVHFEAPKAFGSRASVYKMKIADVWRKWQPTQRAARPERQTNALFPRSRIAAMALRCADEERREIGHTRIVDVIRGEPKPMIRVTTTSGKTLTATHEHQVLTSAGWMRLGTAVRESALLAMEGVTRGLAEGWETPAVWEHERWKDVPGWEGVYMVSDEGRVKRFGCDPKRQTSGLHGYPVVNLNRPGEQVTRTVHTLVLEAFIGPRPVNNEARHLNSNRRDARLSNLAWGSSAENTQDRLHADRQARLVVSFEEIVSVEDAGMLPTFDLSVEGPWHNFIADGFVVHNSYNEMSARYIPLPDENYVPSIERLMMNGGANKQAQGTGAALTESRAAQFRTQLLHAYEVAQQTYAQAIADGVPKELARLPVPVARYSRMRASANLRNWLAFLTLRMDPAAQWEIRQYANAVGTLIEKAFPRTWQMFKEGRPKT